MIDETREYEQPRPVEQSDDPQLELMFADMDEWDAAHPCECHAICTCEDDDA